MQVDVFEDESVQVREIQRPYTAAVLRVPSRQVDVGQDSKWKRLRNALVDLGQGRPLLIGAVCPYLSERPPLGRIRIRVCVFIVFLAVKEREPRQDVQQVFIRRDELADLRRQLEKWRNLEGREGAEMDTLRRSRIELEVRVKELESRVEELEEESGRKDEYVEKQRVKVAKYKSMLEEYKTSIAEYQVRAQDTTIRCDCSDRTSALLS